MSSADELSAPMELVADKYRLTRLLGRGGMGSVWEGVHASLGTRVAVKFIEAEYAGSQEARSRFENEAHAAAKLRSKHVVQVFDHGVLQDGRPYIVMEFLAGEPLDARLDRVGCLPPADTARIVLQLGRALSKAHEAGIVHRDLKPENVFLVWDDDDGADIVKVVDFGIAKFTDGNMGVSSSTRTGSVLGTPYYMSPEQARGLRTVDYRSDLWSVGVIAYRCLVGALPFEGESVGDLLVKICTAPLPVPSQQAAVPQGFDDWFARALQREPQARFGNVLEMAEALCAICGVPVRQRQTSVVGDTGPSLVRAPGPTQLTAQPGREHTVVAAASLTSGTVSPMTQTPAVQRRSRGPLFFAAASAVVVVAVAAVILARFTGGSTESAAQHEEPATTAAAQPPPVEAPPPAPAPPPVEPAPPAAEQQPAATAEATPSAAPHKAAKPVERPRPASRPAPKAAPQPKPDPAPKPDPKPAPKTQIDVGY